MSVTDRATVQPGGENVLSALDARPASRFHWRLVEVFPTWQSGIGLAWVMICFAALCAMAIAFVFWFLPETKGRPVEEIIGLFEREATGGQAEVTASG